VGTGSLESGSPAFGSPSVAVVVEAGQRMGVDVRPRTYPQGTRTAEDAARAIGVDVGAIVKSLVFTVDEEAVLALVSGANRLDEAKLAALAGGSRARRAGVDDVRRETGFAVGGVPPFGHRRRLRTFVDSDLLRYDRVWAAAGTPSANFDVDPERLVRVTEGTVGDLAAR
jgi:Cys-tRNA(Pro) deacylase